MSDCNEIFTCSIWSLLINKNHMDLLKVLVCYTTQSKTVEEFKQKIQDNYCKTSRSYCKNVYVWNEAMYRT